MSSVKTISLLKSGKFLPLLITQFLGAFNDNIFRAAIIMLVTYRLGEAVGIQPAILNNIAVGLFILPYFLFSALAGQLADKYEKKTQVKWIKIWEILLVTGGAYGFFTDNIYVLLTILTGLGLQSTFFGPIKYGVLPDLVDDENLLEANAIVEATTFLAIMIGTSIGGLVILGDNGAENIVILTITIAVLGLISAMFLPKTGQAAPDLGIIKNIFTSTRYLVKDAWHNPISKPSIIGISWMWTVGSIYIAQIPVLTKDRLGGNEDVVTLFLAIFSIGIGLGSLFASRILRGNISAKLATPGLVALLLLCSILYAIIPSVEQHETLIGLSDYLQSPSNIAVMLLLLTLSGAAGVVIVPLYTILQDRSSRAARSRTIAANNIINAIFMATGSLTASFLLAQGLTAMDILLLTGLFGLIFIPYMRGLDKRLTRFDK